MRFLLSKIPINVIWYTASVAVGSLVPILLSLVLARILNLAEFGTWILFVSAYGLLRPLLTMGAIESLRTFFAAAAPGCENKELRHSFKTTIVLSVFWSILFLIAALFVRFDPPYTFIFVFLAIFSGAMESIMTQTFIAIQYTKGAFEYFLHTIRYFFITFILCAFFLLLFKNWHAAALARSLAYLLVCYVGVRIFFTSDISSSITPRPNLITSKLAHFPFELRTVAIPFLLKFAIERDVSLEEVALFGVAYLFGAALNLMFTGEIMFFQERMVKVRSTHPENFHAFIVRGFFAVFIPLILAAISVNFLTPIVLPVFFPPEYSGISRLLPLVLLMSFMFCVFDFFQLLLQAMGLAHIAGWANAVYLIIFLFQVVFGQPVSDVRDLIKFVCLLGFLFLVPGLWYVIKQAKLNVLK